MGWRERSGVEKETAERARNYRAHAEEIRAAAEHVKDFESRSALIRLADTYEKLAARLERDEAGTHPDGTVI